VTYTGSAGRAEEWGKGCRLVVRSKLKSINVGHAVENGWARALSPRA
jgi:hypothetical protein